jgi:hypothetical protein
VVVDAVPILLPVGDGDVMWAYGAAAPRSSRPDDVRFCNNNRIIMVLWMWLLRLRKEDVRTRLGAENGHHFKYNDVCCIIIIIMTTPTIHHLTNRSPWSNSNLLLIVAKNKIKINSERS